MSYSHNQNSFYFSFFRGLCLGVFYIIPILLIVNVTLSDLLLVFFFLSSALTYIFDPNRVREGSLVWGIVFVSSFFFLICFIRSFFSLSLTHFLPYASRGIMFFLFPLSILVFGRSFIGKKEIINVFKIFVFSLSIYAIIWLCIEKIASGLFLKYSEDDSLFFRRFVEKNTSIHGTFISIMVGFAVLISIYFSFARIRKESWGMALLYGLSAVLLLFFQAVLFARTPFFVTWILLPLLIVGQTAKKKTKTTLLLSSLLLIVLLYKSELPIVEKFKNTSVLFFLSEGKKEFKPENERRFMSICAIEKIQQKQFIGYGIGGFERDFSRCVNQRMEPTRTDAQFIEHHPHNNYLFALLIFGIFGLLGLLINVLLPLIYHRSVLYVCFLLLILLCGFTDTLFMRRAMINFYAYFNALFLLMGLLIKKPIVAPRRGYHSKTRKRWLFVHKENVL